jgi:L-cysteine S-thiosulfotransferase
MTLKHEVKVLAPRLVRTSAALAAVLLAGAAGAQGTAEQGFRIMASGSGGNCLACHTIPGQTGAASNFGPALSQVGERYNADELRQWVTDARLIKPDTLMPPFGTTKGTNEPIRAQSMLSFDEIGHVVAALQTLR